jgi:hypothetical protein
MCINILEVNMDKKIISVLMILVLALSIGLQTASATPAAKAAYVAKYVPPAPDPDCGGGLCHKAAPADGGTNLTAYGTLLNSTAKTDYGTSFKNLNVTNKTAVLTKVGNGVTIPPTPELNTGILVTTGIVGLLGLVRMRRRH